MPVSHQLRKPSELSKRVSPMYHTMQHNTHTHTQNSHTKMAEQTSTMLYGPFNILRLILLILSILFFLVFQSGSDKNKALTLLQIYRVHIFIVMSLHAVALNDNCSLNYVIRLLLWKIYVSLTKSTLYSLWIHNTSKFQVSGMLSNMHAAQSKNVINDTIRWLAVCILLIAFVRNIFKWWNMHVRKICSRSSACIPGCLLVRVLILSIKMTFDNLSCFH